MAGPFANTGLWQGDFDEDALQSWARHLRTGLQAPSVTLGLVFMSPRFFKHSAETLEIIRVHAQVPLLIGCSSGGLIHEGSEAEGDPGLCVGLYHLPGAKLTPVHFTQTDVEQGFTSGGWHARSGLAPADVNGWLVFADPFHLDADAWLQQWDAAYPGKPIVGGLASGSQKGSQLYLNGETITEGGIGLAIGGDVTLASLISQGCTPIGETWTITKADKNFIYQIGNRPAYEILIETFAAMSPEEQKLTRGNLFVGLVMNEYQEEFHRGDFLVRNLIGADPNSGVIAVGAHPRAGQTIQFQRRDATAATEDLSALLVRAREKLDGKTVYGGCLCSCNGRGFGLFGYPNHDASAVQRSLGPLALTGFFCNGEIGPVGEHNFLHGYTASLAAFVKA